MESSSVRKEQHLLKGMLLSCVNSPFHSMTIKKGVFSSTEESLNHWFYDFHVREESISSCFPKIKVQLKVYVDEALPMHATVRDSQTDRNGALAVLSVQ